MHCFNFPRLAAVLVTAIVVFVACAQGPGTPGPPDTAPSFADTVDDQTYTEGVGVIPLELPEANGGNGTLSYSLSPTRSGADVRRGHAHAEGYAVHCWQLRHDLPCG